MSLAVRARSWASLVKFSHSVFALPFAAIMLVVVSRGGAVLSWRMGFLLLACIVSARTAAMGFNRIVDRRIDGQNPRTAGREIPAGMVSVLEAAALTAVSGALFIAFAGLIGRHCLVLAGPVLLLLLGYSLLKRYTAACHFALGLALACAPGGVWYAVTGELSPAPLPLMGAVLAWVAGFDILYSCQDSEFDRSLGLRSIPARFGLGTARLLSALLHVAAVALLVIFGRQFSLGCAYWGGLALFALLLASQHVAVQRRGIACIDQVFFTRNGLASVLLCVAVVADGWIG